MGSQQQWQEKNTTEETRRRQEGLPVISGKVLCERPPHLPKVVDLETNRVSMKVVLSGPPHPHKEMGIHSDNNFTCYGNEKFNHQNRTYKVYTDVDSYVNIEMITEKVSCFKTFISSLEIKHHAENSKEVY